MLSGNKRRDRQLLSFYSTRHHPFTKQVHSLPHTIILFRTKEFRRHFKIHCCKHNNTTDGIANLHASLRRTNNNYSNCPVAVTRPGTEG
ncbi:TPA: hypothetical protein F6W26_06720 [Citrobacter amalonaticus]|nr:hypothetical protein [Citrobacter amalonaticus]QDK84817.1 hypothetical protein FEO47_04630 [Citrobacter amalonaticus]HAU4367616.1 hypothetical protein [Citrobacter amalonaticus]